MLEIDRACALASASASAPAPAPAPVHHTLPPRPPEPSATAPLHRPPAAGGGAAQQSTLDRFVDSFTKRRLEKERPASAQVAAGGVGVEPGGGGVGPPGDRAGEGCSRQANEKAVEDRFVESFTRRQREKESAAPEVAWAPAGGQGRPAAGAGKGCSGRGNRAGKGCSGRGNRAGKGCTRQANLEVEYSPCTVALDHEAVKTWTYPSEGFHFCCILPIVVLCCGLHDGI